MLEVNSFLTPYMQSVCYVVSEEKNALIIDPCDMKQIKKFLFDGDKQLEYCFLTHEHCDHISGLEWMHKLHIPVVASEKCNTNLADVRKNQSRYFESFSMLQSRLKGLPIPKVEEYIGYADILFSGQRIIKWHDHELLLRETPGHSEGSICLLIDGRFLFCGDTIFRDYNTNTNILGGNEEDLKNQTLPWIKSLPGDIIVYPGHYDQFTLNEWRERNDTVNL